MAQPIISCSHLQQLSNRELGDIQKNLWEITFNQEEKFPPNQAYCLLCKQTKCLLTTANDDGRQPHLFSLLGNDVFCNACNVFTFSKETDCALVHALHSRKRLANNNSVTENVKFPTIFNYRGLINLGNTCFMNSVLQVVCRISQLKQYFLSGNHEKNCNILNALSSKSSFKSMSNNNNNNHDFKMETESMRYLTIWEREFATIKRKPSPSSETAAAASVPICFGCEVDYVISELYCGSDSNLSLPVIPQAMLESLWAHNASLAAYQQQDAQEYYNFLVNALHSHLCTLDDMKNQSVCQCVAHACFGGVVQSSLTCMTCKSTKRSLDPFFDLSLQIHSNDLHRNNGTMEKRTLGDCLSEYLAVEVLAGEEQVQCDFCNSTKTTHEKQLSILHAPDILVFSFKNYQKLLDDSLVKTQDELDFPLSDFDLTPYVTDGNEQTRVYDLIGLIHHNGEFQGGHYTSYFKEENNVSWVKFDDSFVYKIDHPETLLQISPYLLFYKKRSNMI